MAGIDSLRRLHKKERENNLRKLGHPGATTPCELPGEPLIFSLKAPAGTRILSEQHFTNKKFYSKLRCWFRKWRNIEAPVVLLATFYVTPTDLKSVKVSSKQLREEKTHAVRSYELIDYTLSLMEAMYHAELFATYRQIVKIDVQKFYSSSPRIVLQYMHLEDWKKFYSLPTFYTKAKVGAKEGYEGLLRCELKEPDSNAKGDSRQAS